MKDKKENTCRNPRLGKVGGQAIMEGVMMRSPKRMAIAVRRMDDQKIVVRTSEVKTIRDKYKFLNLPILRGAVNLVESLITSFSTMTASTEMIGLDGLESDSESKLDKWIDKHFGPKMMSIISVISIILGFALAMGLFVALPAGVTNLIFPTSVEGTWKVQPEKTGLFTTADSPEQIYSFSDGTYVYQVDGEEVASGSYSLTDNQLILDGVSVGKANVSTDSISLTASDGTVVKWKRASGNFWMNRLKCLVEGIIKIAIFILYLWLTSLLKDIRRVYQYHGAEHKSIFCYEAGLELTVENVRKQSRFHPRCGTSFMFVMVFLSIFVSIVFIPNVWGWWRILLKILLLPLCVGLGYEFIRYAGKHDNKLVKILSAPGLWMQRITTREPDDTMMEVAIVSIKTALHEEYPDFEIPYESDYLKQKEQAKAEQTPTEEEKTDDTEGVQNQTS